MWGDKSQKKETIFDEEHYTFLGRGVEFKGKAQFDGTVRVDGNFEGEITSRDTLVIGEHAVIKGTITGGVIISGGKVEGNMIASKKVQLLKPAVVIGDVHAPSFAMEEGVLFNGMCDMGVSAGEGLVHEPYDLENVHDISSHREKLRSQET